MSTRNIHVNTASYTLLVAGKKKNTGEEWDVLEFSSLTELKKYRKSHPEKMAFSYSYALSQGVDKQFRHINIAEADHFKQFLRQIKGTVAKLAMRQPFVLFKGLTFQKLCLPGAFRPGDHHNKMLRPGLCVVHASPQYL
uniref:Uncharacterized protein n=14 Tax=Enterobacterales TaxID=91347 RepID=A0A6C7H584_ECOLX|nr:hypothetical protein EIMP119_6k530 [Escherichia coli]